MPTVGPTLPANLQKRKRSPSDPEDATSPSRRIRIGASRGPSNNADELNVHDSSEEEESKPGKPNRVLGPAPPPAKNPDELELEDDSSEDDGYGPSAPDHNAQTSQTQPKQVVGPATPPARNPDGLNLEDNSLEEESKPAQPKRVIGPAPPPANISERPSDSDDSDDDYGPALPPPPGTHNQHQQAQEQRAQAAAAAAAAAEPPKPKRADWMLAPPSDSDWTARVDPTKLTNRKFASGKGARAPAEKGGGVSAIWTETPEEKRRRLEDEVLGRKEKGGLGVDSGRIRHGGGEGDREDRETERRIREYNERNRGRSLMEEFTSKPGGEGKEKEDDPSKRGFDRERDMALGGRLGHGEKREMLAKAKDFGSRFQKGRYL